MVSGDEAETKVKDGIREDKQEEDFEPIEGDLLVLQWVLNAQVDVSE